jgi:hypothetical protein
MMYISNFIVLPDLDLNYLYLDLGYVPGLLLIVLIICIKYFKVKDEINFFIQLYYLVFILQEN